MNLQKFNPWKWFDQQQLKSGAAVTIPVKFNAKLYPQNHQQSFAELRIENDRLFDEAFRNFGVSPFARSSYDKSLSRLGQIAAFNPDINTAAGVIDYVFSLDVPGLSEMDISIEVMNRRLLVKGSKQDACDSKNSGFYHHEEKTISFQRIITLPDDAVVADAKAVLKNAELTIRIPRAGGKISAHKKLSAKN